MRYLLVAGRKRLFSGHVYTSRSIPLLGTPGDHAAREGACTRALARSIGRAGAMVETQSRGGSLDDIMYVAPAR